MGRADYLVFELVEHRLSPVSLQNYTMRCRTDLVRGQDFLVRRTSPYRRQLVFTELGLRRLQLRAYRVFSGHRANLWRWKPGGELPVRRAGQ